MGKIGNKTFEEKLSLTYKEKEAITLKACLDMINGMVNHETMEFFFNNPHLEIRFNTKIHLGYFNILLVDFLSKPKDFFQGDKNYLEKLKDICENPLFNAKYIDQLKVAVQEFISWLSEIIEVEKRWFPSIGIKTDLKIQRQLFITMCGNISKHNFTQLTMQAEKLSKIFKKNGQDVSLEQCLLALKDFYVQFFEDIFAYHSSTIAEFLNNIRWGIFWYAKEERARCVINWYDGEMNTSVYRYEYPKGIVCKLGETYFWNLMNDVKQSPNIPKFVVTKYLKRRY